MPSQVCVLSPQQTDAFLEGKNCVIYFFKSQHTIMPKLSAH